MTDYPAIAPEHLAENARLYANRYDLIRHVFWPGNFANPAIAEIGVAFGDFSTFLIDTLNPWAGLLCGHRHLRHP